MTDPRYCQICRKDIPEGGEEWFGVYTGTRNYTDICEECWEKVQSFLESLEMKAEKGGQE